MNDRTPAQIDNALDRSEQILAQQSIALDRLTLLVEQIGERTNARLTQHDHELDDQDERTERLENILLAHEGQMTELRESRADMKSMLDILLRRSIGETNE